MTKRFLVALILAAGCLTLSADEIVTGKQPLPLYPVIPDGLGYNIHFTDAKPGEMEMIAESGATIIRMDFGWNGTEREKGIYDFSPFERLTDSLEKHKMRPLYILDYSNRHYDEGLSPYSEEGRKAFAHWAAAAAVHFKGRGILWEMYNEPNISQFWKPRANPDDYIKLALEVGKALQEAAPGELYIGPATSEMDFDFLEKCFKAGLLEYWDAVSVHPYRQTDPETVIEEYAKLRYMIDKYAPKGKQIPILSGEWGYSSAWRNYNDDRQGKMLPRQWMVNLACDVPVSIWYDWHDDGTDPKEPEHHFGTVNHEYHRDRAPVYDPKPAYIAAKTFTETFRGLRYNKRMMEVIAGDFGGPGVDHDVYIFLFSNSDHSAVKFAIWTTAREAKAITIPWMPGKYEAISYLGEKLPVIVNGDKLTLTVSDSPIYLTPEKSEVWIAVAKTEPLPLAVYRDQMLERLYGRSTIRGRVGAVSQLTTFLSANPIKFSVPFLEGDTLVLFVDNPSGEALSSQYISISNIEGLELVETMRTLKLDQGQTTTSLVFPVKTKPTGTYKFRVHLPSPNMSLFPPRTMRPLDDFTQYGTQSLNAAWEIVPDGDSNVGSEQRIEMTEDGHVKITYRFDEGWKFIRLAPKDESLRTMTDDIPQTLGVCLEGDGSGNRVRLRFTDARGRTYQPDGGAMTEKKPYYFSFPLYDANVPHWGGTEGDEPDDRIVYPIRFDSLVIDGTRSATGPHSITLLSPMVVIYDR